MAKARVVRSNPVMELIHIRRVAPNVVTLSHVHASDRVGDYRGHPVCSGHILTVLWWPRSARYLGARAFFYKKGSHWMFLVSDGHEKEITPGASARTEDESVYQLLAKKFLSLRPSKGALAPMIGHHAGEIES